MKEKIIGFCHENQIEYVGIAPALPMEELKNHILARRKKYGISSFEEKDIEKRTNPKLIMDDAKSIIVCLFPYNVGENKKTNISSYAKIPDYHIIVKNKLEKICAFIKTVKEDAKLVSYTDTGPLADKYLAYLAGLGFWGKNSLIINDKYGSYIFIGYIVTNLDLEPDKPSGKTCAGCNKCIESCPGNAILNEFDFNCQNCVSYITQLKEINDLQRKILEKQSSVYGCDICQTVCPHNENAVKTPIKEFYEKKVDKLSKNELLNMTNKEFKEKYGDFPFSWRGKAVILKNFTDKT